MGEQADDLFGAGFDRFVGGVDHPKALLIKKVIGCAHFGDHRIAVYIALFANASAGGPVAAMGDQLCRFDHQPKDPVLGYCKELRRWGNLRNKGNVGSFPAQNGEVHR